MIQFDYVSIRLKPPVVGPPGHIAATDVLQLLTQFEADRCDRAGCLGGVDVDSHNEVISNCM